MEKRKKVVERQLNFLPFRHPKWGAPQVSCSTTMPEVWPALSGVWTLVPCPYSGTLRSLIWVEFEGPLV